MKNFTKLIWKHSSQPTPIIPRANIGDEKVMFTVFFSEEGIQFIHQLPHGETMNSRTFVKDVLTPLQNKYVQQKHAKQIEITIHHDNSRLHTAKHTKQFLQNSVFDQLQHPAYFPDIAPCDLSLFGILKKELKGVMIANELQAYDLVSRILAEIHQIEIWRTLRSWITLLQWIAKHDGDYQSKDKR
ncbi:MAG: hypothetical protein EZS28_018951 [Streblomastix strix]|uniref:Mariner Mos1 transposase n=1 Tax=Streblomastix strix TaxID=222440 RepID=A0A5J4VSI1_9EUKA|nr:MAG: hypothetical protein EZS28_018951 [Streblomastix strix]